MLPPVWWFSKVWKKIPGVTQGILVLSGSLRQLRTFGWGTEAFFCWEELPPLSLPQAVSFSSSARRRLRIWMMRIARSMRRWIPWWKVTKHWVHCSTGVAFVCLSGVQNECSSEAGSWWEVLVCQSWTYWGESSSLSPDQSAASVLRRQILGVVSSNWCEPFAEGHLSCGNRQEPILGALAPFQLLGWERNTWQATSIR